MSFKTTSVDASFGLGEMDELEGDELESDELESDEVWRGGVLGEGMC